ncbi:uncharacterized protein IUM83_18574 [Phytophthora cinnamomi]|uniref:uncharacterized protein n=1 Tax=Phytophthora cinnamomi TaxID=4785 RepID=UPI0035595C0A|nr:hypothetical protein IUM83_18574 [Phytophthora cinnamomi]
MPERPETWDFSWMAAATQSLETYEAALETAEFPSLLLAALDELLQAPERNATPLQELADVLLQMIEFPIDLELPRETVTTLHSARDWAIQTLLDVQAARPAAAPWAEYVLQPPTTSASLQQMQTALFVSAPCRQAEVQMELHQSLLAAVQAEEESDAVSDMLELCATSLEDDAQFLQFAETALSGRAESLALGKAFLRRLFERRSAQLQSDDPSNEQRMLRGRKLFDELTLGAKVRVWANHLPSWRSQLQTWMLEAHRSPFKSISFVLPDGWWADEGSDADFPGCAVVTAACRRYSHLYVTFIEWCRSHVDLLSSCRGAELVSVLSQSTRHQNAARLFSRKLMSQVSLLDRSPNGRSWSSGQRERAFLVLGNNLQQLQASRTASDNSWQYEWIGVLEHPQLLHEALEISFSKDISGPKQDKTQDIAHNAAQFFGWFYSFSSFESAIEIAELVSQMSSKLKMSDVRSGAQWLRRSRADFGVLPIVRLRLVWFWLLKNIDIAFQTSVTVNDPAAAAATTDVLESVEYVFRRFTLPRAKRPFQVELVTQLLVELEWRARNVSAKTENSFLGRIAPLCAWLTKIVRLMQLEEQTVQQKDGRSRYGSRRSFSNDVEHLADRLARFSG